MARPIVPSQPGGELRNLHTTIGADRRAILEDIAALEQRTLSNVTRMAVDQYIDAWIASQHNGEDHRRSLDDGRCSDE